MKMLSSVHIWITFPTLIKKYSSNLLRLCHIFHIGHVSIILIFLLNPLSIGRVVCRHMYCTASLAALNEKGVILQRSFHYGFASLPRLSELLHPQFIISNCPVACSQLLKAQPLLIELYSLMLIDQRLTGSILEKESLAEQHKRSQDYVELLSIVNRALKREQRTAYVSHSRVWKRKSIFTDMSVSYLSCRPFWAAGAWKSQLQTSVDQARAKEAISKRQYFTQINLNTLNTNTDTVLLDDCSNWLGRNGTRLSSIRHEWYRVNSPSLSCFPSHFGCVKDMVVVMLV